MRRLCLEHRRMLGNGWCTRPAKVDCAFETICEGCGFFQTTIAFRPTLQAQHDDAAAKGQDGRQSCSRTCSTAPPLGPPDNPAPPDRSGPHRPDRSPAYHANA